MSGVGASSSSTSPPNTMVVFQAPDVTQTSRRSAVVTDLWWTGLSRGGLTYEGTCPNEQCMAWTKGSTLWPGRTACKKAFGQYRPNEDSDYGMITCPGCGVQLAPDRFVFRKCSCTVQYCMANAEPTAFTFSVDTDEELYILGERGKKLTYTSLVFDVQQPGVYANQPPDVKVNRFLDLTNVVRL